jgi:hypothetical protein
MANENKSDYRLIRNKLVIQNDEGVVLPAGTPVYIKSNSNGTVLIGKADSDSVSKMPAIGITQSRVDINQDVEITIGGFFDVSIGGLTGAAAGNNLYVASGGGLTTVEPSGEVQSLGKILTANAAGTVALETLIAFGGASAGGGGGASEFIALDDTPANYSGATAGQVVAVNGTTDGVEFIDAPSPVGIDLALVTRDAAFGSAGDHEGTTLSIGTAALTTGTVYMWGPTDWGAANAGAVATADGLMGVATTNTAGGDVLVKGIIQLSSVPGSAGDVLYLDTTNGTLTATAPTGSQEIVRVMGYNLDGSRIYFNPSQDWLEIV